MCINDEGDAEPSCMALLLIYSFIMISRLDIHGVLMYRKNILSATDEDADSDIKDEY